MSDDLARELNEEVEMALEDGEDMKCQEDIDEEDNVKQLLIDESVTTLISSKVKGASSICKPYKKVMTIPTASFCDRLDKCLSSNELLPRNVRYYVSSRRGTILVIEEEPAMRSITVDCSFESVIENLRVTGKLEEFGYTDFLQDNKPPYRFSLSFPYIVYVIHLLPYPSSPVGRLSVFYRNAPLNTLMDPLFKCSLLNIGSNGVCCMGDINIPRSLDLNLKVNAVFDSFWNSTFNREIRENYDCYEQNPHLSSFLHWQYYSNKDPMFIMSEDFIPANQTVASVISALSDDRGKILDSYKSIVDILFNDTHIINETTSLYSVSQMPLTKEGTILDSGEEVVIHSEKCFVVDFLRNEKSFVKMRVENEKGDVIDLNLTPSLVTSLANHVKNKKYVESITIKGQEIKPGKVIKFSEPESYTTIVRKILKDRNDGFLTKCGRDYYLLENIDFELFDENQFKVGGLTLEKGKKYIILGSRSEQMPYFYKTEIPSSVIYDGFSDGNSDDENIGLKFNGLGIIDFDELNQYNIFCEDSIQKAEVVRSGRRLLEGCTIIKNVGVYSRSIKSLTSNSITKLVQEILSKQELFIPSFDFDIKFSVGDKVVIPDWLNPASLTQIRTITGFRSSGSLQTLDILSITDGDHSPFITKYLDFTDSATINVGSVRKISEEFNGIKSGFKLVAKSRGIQNFMKKDCYTVVGFITDTGNGIPLMLCSNLCTIWCTKQDLENFDFFEPSSSKFSRLTVSQPLSSVSFQPGDLIFSNRARARCCEDRVLLLLNRPSFGQYFGVLKPSNSTACKCYKDVIEPVTLYGIPNPRIKLDLKFLTESPDFERISAYPGFHNTFLDTSGRFSSGSKIFIRREEKNDVSNLFSR